jgi:anthranilate phosphoribosyltransferase
MTSPRPDWYDAAMARLFAREALDAATVSSAIRDLKAGLVSEAHATAYLVAMRCKGETADELAAAANVLRADMIPIATNGRPVLDTCGTGGDDAGTFNISTAAALVAAACGVPVVKHGNRAVSSKSGSADLLTGLGVPIENGLGWAQSCLDRHGFAFCFAPHVHPGMAAVGPLRRTLGVRTIFNLIGPLSNPAKAEFQLLGVGRPELLVPMAGAIAKLGVTRAAVVHGGGLDEVSLETPTLVRVVRESKVSSLTWSAADFGLDPTPVAAIRASTTAESLAIVRRVFDGSDPGPATRYVLANAAAALWVAGQVGTLPDGVAIARDAIRHGKVTGLIARLSERPAA